MAILRGSHEGSFIGIIVFMWVNPCTTLDEDVNDILVTRSRRE
jgi:hypothetical protein